MKAGRFGEEKTMLRTALLPLMLAAIGPALAATPAAQAGSRASTIAPRGQPRPL